MEYGVDDNGDGKPDDAEVDGSYTICHGEPGAVTVTVTEPVPWGAKSV
jgi:hypothetical protein